MCQELFNFLDYQAISFIDKPALSLWSFQPFFVLLGCHQLPIQPIKNLNDIHFQIKIQPTAYINRYRAL